MSVEKTIPANRLLKAIHSKRRRKTKQKKEGKISATYIKNPLENVMFEKRVKNYEWYCEKYNGSEYTFILNR